MSMITGTFLNRDKQRATQLPVLFRYLSNPAIATSFGIYVPDKLIKTNQVGKFSTPLPMGTYDMYVGVDNIPRYRIVVPDDDITYDFTQRLDPESLFTQSVAYPLAVLGLWIRQNIAELKVVPSGTANRMAVLWNPDDAGYAFYRWVEDSVLAEAIPTVIVPDDIDDIAIPGRWLWMDGTAGGGSGGDGSSALTGHGSPEGVVAAVPGRFYIDLDVPALFYKVTGTGTTGWQESTG